MKTIKKSLCMLLSIVMILGTVVVGFNGFDSTNFAKKLSGLFANKAEANVTKESPDGSGSLSFSQSVYAPESIWLTPGGSSFKYVATWNKNTGTANSGVKNFSSGGYDTLEFDYKAATNVKLAVNKVYYYNGATETAVAANKLTLNIGGTDKTIATYANCGATSNGWSGSPTIVAEGTNVINVQLKGGLLADAAPETTYFIQWVFQYTVKGETHLTYMYTAVYAPSIGSAGMVGSDERQRTSFNKPLQLSMVLITGAMKYSGGNYKYNQTPIVNSYTGSSTGYEISDLPSGHYTKQDNGGFFIGTKTFKTSSDDSDDTSTDDANRHNYKTAWTSDGKGAPTLTYGQAIDLSDKNVRYLFENRDSTAANTTSESRKDKGKEEKTTAGVAYVVADTSRFTNYNQIPNLVTALYCYHKDRSTGNPEWVRSINDSIFTDITTNHISASIDRSGWGSGSVRGPYTLNGTIQSGFDTIAYSIYQMASGTWDDNELYQRLTIGLHTTAVDKSSWRSIYAEAATSHIDNKTYSGNYSSYYSDIKKLAEALCDPQAYTQPSISITKTAIENEDKRIFGTLGAAGVYFYAPEVIYLYPNGTSFKDATSTPFEYFVENSVGTGADLPATVSTSATTNTNGTLYFQFTEADSVSFTAKAFDASMAALSSGGNINSTAIGSWSASGSKPSGKNYFTCTITGDNCMSPSLASTTTGYYIQWTATYTDKTDGFTKQAVAYSYVYKPYVVPLAGGADAGYDSNDHFAGNVTWISGIHSITESASAYYGYAGKSTYNGSYFVGSNGTGAYIGSTKLTSANAGKKVNEILNVGTISYATGATQDYVLFQGTGNSADVNAAFSNNTTAASYQSATITANTFNVRNFYGETSKTTYDYNVFRIVHPSKAKIFIDTSRYDNLSQIPNLRIGFGVNDDDSSAANTGGWYIASYTGLNGASRCSTISQRSVDNTRSKTDWSSVLNDKGALIASQYNSTNGESEYNTNEGLRYAGKWPEKISSSTATYSIKGQYINFSGKWGYAGMSVSILDMNATQFNKANIRTAVNDTIAKFDEFGLYIDADGNFQSIYYQNNANWQSFVTAYKNACAVLTKVDGVYSTSYDTQDKINSLATTLSSYLTGGSFIRKTGTAQQRNVILSGTTMRNFSTAQTHSQPYNYGDNVFFSADSNNGYSFKGFIKTNSDFDPGTGTTVSINDASYNLNGSTYSTNAVSSGTFTNSPVTADALALRNYYNVASTVTMSDTAVDYTNVVDPSIYYLGVYELITYEIDYNLNGGTLATQNTGTYTIESNDVAINNAPTRNGYTFAGWELSTDGAFASGSVTSGLNVTIKKGSYGNVTATANWIPNKTVITFDKENLYNLSTDLSFWDAHPDYTIIDAVNKTIELKSVSGDEHVAAANTDYPKNKITVTPGKSYIISYTVECTDKKARIVIRYNNGSGEVASAVYTGSGNHYYIITVPDGCNSINISYANNDQTGNANASAIFSNIRVSEYDENEPLYAVTATYGEAMPNAEIPTKTGYTFAGYYDGKNGTGAQYYDENGVCVSEKTWDKDVANTTLYAKWNPIEYKVKYNANGGSGTMSDSTHKYNESKALSENKFTKSGYSFAGWEGNEYTYDVVATDRNEYVGNYLSATGTNNHSLKKITVSGPFNTGDVFVVECDIKYTNNGQAPTEGNGGFGTYFYGDTGFLQCESSINSMGTSNTSRGDGWLVASKSDSYVHYTVMYTLKSADDSNKNIDKYLLFRVWDGANASVRNIVIKKRSATPQTFTDGQSVINLTENPLETVELKAKWTANPLDVTYDELFDINKYSDKNATVSGNTITVSSTTTNAEAKIPVSADGEYLLKFSETVSGTKGYPRVTFYNNSDQPVYYSLKPYDESDNNYYHFDKDFVSRFPNNNVDEDWTAGEINKKNLVIFVNSIYDGGALAYWAQTTTSYSGQSVHVPYEPADAGEGLSYRFMVPTDATYLKVEFVADGGTTTFSNISLKRVQHYTLDDSDIGGKDINIASAGAVIDRPGYTFTGWKINNTGDIIGNSVNLSTYTDGVSLTSQWNSTDYGISYTLNSGTNSAQNPARYNIESNDITLQNPTRDGYNFTGWTLTGATFASGSVTSGTATNKAKIATGTYGGNITATAAWNYTVGFDNLFLAGKWYNSDSSKLNGTGSVSFDSSTDGITIQNGESTAGKEVYTKSQGNESNGYYSISVEAGKTYNISASLSDETKEHFGLAEVFVFFYNDNNESVTYQGDNSYYKKSFDSYSINESFTVPSGATKIAIRFDNNSNGKLTYQNVRIIDKSIADYGATYSIAGSTVADSQKPTFATATRNGYVLAGWNAQADGTGTTYTSADYSGGNATLYSQWEAIAVDDTFVMDFGVPATLGVTSNDIDGATVTAIDYSSIASTDATVTLNNGEITFTPKSILSKTLSFTYTATVNGNSGTATVTIIPANNVYYEEDFVTFDKGTTTETLWTDDTSTTQPTDVDFALKRAGEDGVFYGDNSAYNQSCNYSMGNAKKITVTAADKWSKYAQFTFTGTGFDVYGITGNTCGYFAVYVKEGEEYKANDEDDQSKGYKSYDFNTYTGYKYTALCYDETNKTLASTGTPLYTKGSDPVYVKGVTYYKTNGDENDRAYGWLLNDDAGTPLYQVPVVSQIGLTYGTYTVRIYPVYVKGMDVASKGQFDFVLDSIRIYNPMGTNITNDTVNAAYNADKENDAKFLEIRDALLSYKEAKNAMGSASGVAFFGINWNGKTTTFKDYENVGPKNEVYLAPGQGISFDIAYTGGKPDKVAVGVRLLTGTAGQLGVGSKSGYTTYIDVSSKTDLFRDITSYLTFESDSNVQGKGTATVIIANNNASDSGVNIALTKLKVTYASVADDPTQPHEVSAPARSMVGDGEATERTVELVFNPVNFKAAAERFFMEKPTIDAGEVTVQWENEKVEFGDPARLFITAPEKVTKVTVDGSEVSGYETLSDGSKKWTFVTYGEGLGNKEFNVVAFVPDGEGDFVQSQSIGTGIVTFVKPVIDIKDAGIEFENDEIKLNETTTLNIETSTKVAAVYVGDTRYTDFDLKDGKRVFTVDITPTKTGKNDFVIKLESITGDTTETITKSITVTDYVVDSKGVTVKWSAGTIKQYESATLTVKTAENIVKVEVDGKAMKLVKTENGEKTWEITYTEDKPGTKEVNIKLTDENEMKSENIKSGKLTIRKLTFWERIVRFFKKLFGLI